MWKSRHIAISAPDTRLATHQYPSSVRLSTARNKTQDLVDKLTNVSPSAELWCEKLQNAVRVLVIVKRPGQALRGSRRLRLPHFKTIDT
jgi:hypothetical protein